MGGALMGASGGSSGKGGSPPAEPDFAAAATPNQTNAFGVNSSWNKGADGKMNQTQSFGGPLGDLNQNLQGQAANAWQSPLDNGAQARQHAEDAIYSRGASRLDPQFAQQEQGLNSSMANQGLDPGSQAFNNAYGNFSRAKNDAYGSLSQDAIMGGGQEASRQQGMDLQSRMAPLAGLSGMSGLTGQSQNPLLPAAMAQYQGDLQKYGIDQQGKNSMMGGLSGLGGSAMMAAALSDERMKEGIVRLDEEAMPGVKLARFRYRDDPSGQEYEGVIAQDVEAAGSGHLITEINGLKHVPGFLAPRPVTHG
jgi:hypothetical protein